jgi:hypothetical protein
MLASSVESTAYNTKEAQQNIAQEHRYAAVSDRQQR